MSSSNPTPVATKHEFLVILPDHPNALDKRMSVRPSHLSALTPAVDSGFWTLGGATLAHPIADGQPAGPPPITGSVMLALATSEEEVRERLKADVYFREGVWDWDRVVVYPFKSAFRKELQK